MEARNIAILTAFRIILSAITIIIAMNDFNFALVFAFAMGAIIVYVDEGFELSEKLTIYDRILSYGNNHLGKTMTFETLSDNFDGLYTKDELAEAIHQLNHAKLVTVNGY